MKKPNITPGPWHAEKCCSHISVSRACYPRDAWQIASFGHQAHDAANARFIAAAPKMAEALAAMLQAYAPFHQESVDHKGSEEGLHSAVRDARNALKSAGYEF